MSKIIFRVDGGNVWGISMGHIIRSLSLANHLKKRYKIIFLMKNYFDGVDYVKKLGWDVYTISIEDDTDETLIDFCKEQKPVKIIFDLNNFNFPFFTQYAKEIGLDVIVFDIKGNVQGEPSTIINDSIAHEHVNYHHLDKNIKLYIGPKFFLLPKEYLNKNEKKINLVAKNIVITMGGSDPAGLTIKIIKGIHSNFLNVHYHIILGPAFDNTKIIKEVSESLQNVSIYIDPPNFMNILFNADIAITAGGRTLFESAFLGIPVIILPSIEHELVTAIEYSKRTDAINLGMWDDERSPHSLFLSLRNYLNNYEKRQSISKASKNLIDGMGLFRVIDIIG